MKTGSDTQNLPGPAIDIEQVILVIRGQRVMLDADLARLYAVETRALLQAVRRNRERFPPDFAFRLNPEEAGNLRSQLVISSGWGGRRHAPYAFAEQGVAMLSSVLRSRQAIRANIMIMRAFVRLREMAAAHAGLAAELEKLRSRVDGHDESIDAIMEALNHLLSPPATETRRIGFDVA